ncbi:ATP-binding protein [Streptomyces sp. NPDC005865]|uniref:ATP-binding protein n=1 Tax=Streptomyces sp. NPDC005865 TaxID=3155453 RepID=UPI0033D7616E
MNRPIEPPPGPQTYHLTTPNTPLSPKICRDTLTLLLAANGRSELADTARTLVSEVVTNAVTHTVSPTIGMEACVLADGGVRVCVYDDCRAEPLAALDVSRDSEHGRGLFLVQALAHEWGTAPAPRQVRAGGGKHVWFELRQEGRSGNGIYRVLTILDN